MQDEESFLGRGWSFPPTFNQSGAVIEMVSGQEDIKQSLQILLSTSVRERLMHPDFGCELNQFVFEEITLNVIGQIKSIIMNAILYYEPRIDLNKIDVTSQEGQGVLLIEINYTIRVTNSRSNLVFPFYLTEATHLIL